jgi:hypothetical protein
MAVKNATLEIESTGQSAHFETDVTAADGQQWNVPALIIEVEDFEEALEVVETLNRSGARKRAQKGSSPAPAVDPAPPAGETAARGREVPKPAKPPPRCETPECANEGMVAFEGGNFCPLHAAVDPSIAREWHAAFIKANHATPAKEGRRRAGEIAARLGGTNASGEQKAS